MTQAVEQYFQPALLDVPDLWLWDLLLAPVVKSWGSAELRDNNGVRLGTRCGLSPRRAYASKSISAESP